MYEQSVHSRNLLKFVEIYIVKNCIIDCFESFVIKLLWEFVDEVVVRVCWMNIVNNHLNMLLKICHLIMMKMQWMIYNQLAYCECLWWSIDKEMYHSLLKWMFARSFLKNIRWMFAMNNTSLNLLRRMLWRMLRRMLRRMLWKSSLNVCWRCDEECCDNVVISLLKICHIKLYWCLLSMKYVVKVCDE